MRQAKPGALTEEFVGRAESTDWTSFALRGGALDACADPRMHDIAMSPAGFPAGIEVVLPPAEA